MAITDTLQNILKKQQTRLQNGQVNLGDPERLASTVGGSLLTFYGLRRGSLFGLLLFLLPAVQCLFATFFRRNAAHVGKLVKVSLRENTGITLQHLKFDSMVDVFTFTGRQLLYVFRSLIFEISSC